MADLDAIHEEIDRIREETDASREVRLALQSIGQSLADMESPDDAPGMYPDRLREVRAEIDRLEDNAEGETAGELGRLREQVRALEREVT